VAEGGWWAGAAARLACACACSTWTSTSTVDGPVKWALSLVVPLKWLLLVKSAPTPLPPMASPRPLTKVFQAAKPSSPGWRKISRNSDEQCT
jgi:hypothetical protein